MYYCYMSKIGSEMYIYIYLSSGQYVYVGKDGRIRGCFSKPNGVREQKRLGNTDIDIIMV